MKPIRIESGIIVYYGNRVGRVSDGRAVVDPMFEGPELIDFLTKQRNIREVQWTDGMFDRLMSAPPGRPRNGGIKELPYLAAQA